MTGIQYVTDEDGRKTAVLIDLNIHGELWEDIQDMLVSRERQKEKGVPFEEVKTELIEHGKLRG